jgi:DnaJ-class molecular chaperone
MVGQAHDRRLDELFWPGKRASCPKCKGAGDVHWTMQYTSAPSYEVIGGRRATCSVCGGSGQVQVECG